jgi:hypothetical protein
MESGGEQALSQKVLKVYSGHQLVAYRYRQYSTHAMSFPPESVTLNFFGGIVIGVSIL